MIRFGDIAYLNTLPVMAGFWQDQASDPSLPMTRVVGTPAQLNAALLSGTLDISGISAACYAQHREQLVLLPDLSISSQGPVESVLLLSPVPWQDLPSQPWIHVSGASASAATMLRVLLPTISQRVYPPELLTEILESGEPVLVIGDQALTLNPETISHVYLFDVATQWVNATGLPAVFGVWAARRAWVEAHPEQYQVICDALHQSKARFFQDRDFQIKVIAEARDAASATELQRLSLERITRYLTQSIQYDWSHAHETALEQFYPVESLLV